MNKKRAIMLADNRIALIGQILVQLSEKNKDNIDEVIIMDSGISENDKTIMKSIMPCRFIEYNSPLPKELFNEKRFKRFSELMFARYEMFRLLDEYSMIMWLDTDIVIQDSFQELLYKSEKYPISILCEDPENKSSKNVDTMRTNFFKELPQYDMNAYLYCTGIIIVRDSLKQKCDYCEWCYNKTIEWADNLNLPDQGVINALFQEFDIQPYRIGQHGKFGCYPYYGRNCNDSIIVHSWGKNKFWNDCYLNQAFPKWEECYEKWIKLGGCSMNRNVIPEVSVVIPVYKPDLGYLRQCIESIYAQKMEEHELYSNYEIIIVAEPFNIEEIKEFIKEYNDVRIKLIFNDERLGIAASLNRGLREAKGKYILRIDDDDIAEPTRFKKQVDYLNSHPEVDLCTSDYMYFGDMNEGRVAFEGEMSRAWSILTCPFDHPTIMFRRNFFIDNNLFYDEDRGFVEDWELWQRAFKKGMKVGCINEILFYHRWHNGSAGQTNKTVEMMRQMIKSNMAELNVNIPDEDLWLLSPWNGKIQEKKELLKLESYFREALENNSLLKIYDQFCLARVFSLRMSEANVGKLSELIIPNYGSIKEEHNENNASCEKNNNKPSIFRRVLKSVFKPFYKPFYNRYESRIANIQEMTWRVECGINRIYEEIDDKFKRIQEKYESEANKIQEKYESEFNRVNESLNNQAIEFKNNLINELSAFKEMIDYEKLRPQFNEVHRHIDFESRDILIALERASKFLPDDKIVLETNNPIAYESLDYIYPRGTIQDNTRYPRFVKKCETLFGQSKELSFLDLGCSGGGMVLEALLRGHNSYGLEGSDASLKEQRAEWRLIGNHLMTCDITKPFNLKNENNNICKFNIITAWEVLEHLSDDELEGLFDNIKRHLKDDGIFVASIANWDDIDEESGVNWHVNVHEYSWWRSKFENAGFKICSDLFDVWDLARGGYNPPHCYEQPYDYVDRDISFHIAVKK